MRSHVQDWVNSCLQCQASKVQRHNKAPVQTIDNNVPKFSAVHLDLVGPLPPNNGCAYLLTIIDRFTRWPEAIPIPDMSTETICNAFMLHWVARFGVPDSITTDRGSQFESRFFNKLLEILGITHNRTTAYHAQSNGLIERWHRSLKNALRSTEQHNWIERLPLVLLGLRSTIKDEIGCAPALAMYGCSLKLPIDLLDSPQKDVSFNISSYADRLRQHMQQLHPPTTRQPKCSSYVDSKLSQASYVFVRNDSKTGLLPNYKGPFKVLERGDKFFTIQTDRKIDTVSIDRLKCAKLPLDYFPDPQEEVYLPPTLPVPTARFCTSPTPHQQESAQQPSYIPRPSAGRPAPGRADRTVPSSSSRGRAKRVTYADIDTRIPPIKVTRSGRISKPPGRFK